jgi:uncharacterized protein (TIGR00725 family)
VKKVIGVIGSSSDDKKTYDLAFHVGELIADSNAVVVCGGLTGVMEAVCKGAKSKGGTTIGILPGLETADANKWVDYPIATGLGHARNMIIINTAQSLIAISSGYGTLSEIAFALSSGKKVYGLGTWDIKGVVICETPEIAVSNALINI